MSDIKLSLVVPCYNEGQNVKPFYDAASAVLRGSVEEYELIFVNDGSQDNTWDELKKIYKDDPRVKIINFSRNFGKEAAMYAGLQKSVGEYVTVIDADLQQKPELAVEMVGFLEQNPEYDSVVMFQKERREGKVLSFFKRAFYKIINAMCDTDFRSGASDFRTFRRYVVDSILEMKEYFRFSKGIFSWVGFNTHYMPYIPEERHSGKTSWSFRKLFKYAIDGITDFTTVPLKLSTYIGSLCSAFSLIYMIVVIIQKLCFGINVPGYATTVVLISLIGGIQLIVLGVMGQYISKIYIEGKKRPIYITKEYLDGDKREDREKN